MIFVISSKSKMVKRIYSVGCENSGTYRVDYYGSFFRGDGEGEELGGRLVKNVCHNSERKIYGHSLEEAR